MPPPPHLTKTSKQDTTRWGVPNKAGWLSDMTWLNAYPSTTAHLTIVSCHRLTASRPHRRRGADILLALRLLSCNRGLLSCHRLYFASANSPGCLDIGTSRKHTVVLVRIRTDPHCLIKHRGSSNRIVIPAGRAPITRHRLSYLLSYPGFRSITAL